MSAAAHRVDRHAQRCVHVASRFPGVRHQVGQQQLQLGRVGVDGGPCVGQLGHQRHMRRQGRPQHPQAVPARLGEVERRVVAGALSQIREQQATHLGGLAGRQHRLAQRVGGQAGRGDGQLEVVHHHRQLVVEVVGDGAGHARQALHLLSLLELPLELQALLLVPFAIRDVAHDGSAHLGGAVGAGRRGGFQARPELRAIGLSQAHFDDLRHAGGQQTLQVQVVRILIVGREEARHPLIDQGTSRHAEQRCGRQVGFDDQTCVADGDVAHGRHVVQIEVAGTGCLQRRLGAPQLFVLHLELDLVDAQVVQYRRLGRRHGTGLGRVIDGSLERAIDGGLAQAAFRPASQVVLHGFAGATGRSVVAMAYAAP